MLSVERREDKGVFQKFNKFILEDFHPCVMAKTVFSNGKNLTLKSYEDFGDRETSLKILNDLDNYISKVHSGDGKEFFSFIATFPNLVVNDEEEFEKIFWQKLQLLHDLDTAPWDEEVSADPSSNKFSFSLRGHAFYLIGLHPKSSRMARRAPHPSIVFNLHSQFEQLRGMGIYQRIRNKIRKNDKKLQGNINPMLADFGDSSEARQYSGKAVGEDWKCPFHANLNKLKKLCFRPFLRKAE